jgi:acyl-CoA synthetase (AMP-forming)/AMP-acid ligase II
MNFTHDSVNLVPMPMYHVGGLAWTLLSLHRGAPSIVVSDVVPAELVAIVQKFRVTHAFVVPTVLAGLVELPDLAAWDLSSLEGLAYGGSPIPLPLLRRLLQATDAGLYQVYGATEVSGVATVLDAADHRAPLDERHLRSAGRPLDGLEVAIVDPETGRRNAPSEVGEVHIRGDQIMAGYWRAPEATEAAVAPGGWFRTGDAGYLDDRGYLFVVDRVKDLIISGGENIYPAELERVLAEHPAVAEVAVIGVPDEKWGEVPKAVIVPVAGRTPETADVLRFCRDHLAAYKCPKSVDLVAALPRNGAGKIMKRDLRESYWRGRDT